MCQQQYIENLFFANRTRKLSEDIVFNIKENQVIFTLWHIASSFV